MRVYPIRVLHMIASLEIGGSQIMIINLYRAICRVFFAKKWMIF